jgi:hypothetical protein
MALWGKVGEWASRRGISMSWDEGFSLVREARERVTHAARTQGSSLGARLDDVVNPRVGSTGAGAAGGLPTTRAVDPTSPTWHMPGAPTPSTTRPGEWVSPSVGYTGAPVHGPVNVGPVHGPPVPGMPGGGRGGYGLGPTTRGGGFFGGIGRAVTNHPLAAMGIGVAAVTIPGAAEGMFNMAELAAFGRDDVDQAVLGQDIGLSAMYQLPSFLRAPPAWDMLQYRNSPVIVEGAFGRDPRFDAGTSQDWYAALDTVESSRGNGSDYQRRGDNWQSAYPYRPSSVRRGMAADGSMVFGMYNLR